MNCQQRIGFTKQQQPMLCKQPVPVRLTNAEGLARYFCDEHLLEYRDTWNMSMGTDQAQAFWDKTFIVTPLAPVAP